AHPEEVLDGLTDLDAIGPGMDDERVHARLHQRVRLLAHHRLENHVARVVHWDTAFGGVHERKPFCHIGSLAFGSLTPAPQPARAQRPAVTPVPPREPLLPRRRAGWPW